ncbi:hypothetical protein TRFO_43276 [Tritrichomonas foetus]|uniref:Uncharacterized protein n=1 Tax=Tritrichomonas foetus TaxID=1144522 RepID=A0A1J4KR24_9EUKA|nr:hypothetical protein TRFO_43276 [Tritrichomonas foetus]|eukprot:OHT13711.1 hypothetical protein TRFO_43276 [Tritrichomonas foetus]
MFDRMKPNIFTLNFFFFFFLFFSPILFLLKSAVLLEIIIRISPTIIYFMRDYENFHFVNKWIENRSQNCEDYIYSNVSIGVANQMLTYLTVILLSNYHQKISMLPQLKYIQFPNVVTITSKVNQSCPKYNGNRAFFPFLKEIDFVPNYVISISPQFPHYLFFCDQYSFFFFHHFDENIFYFFFNFFILFPKEIYISSLLIFNTIPNNLFLFGIHLRFHANNFQFMKNTSETFKIVLPFLQNMIARKNLIFYLASDNEQIIGVISSLFGSKCISAQIIHQPDSDSSISLIDFVSLIYCQQRLLTQFSTFSCCTMLKTNKKAYYFQRGFSFILKYKSCLAGLITIFRVDYKPYRLSCNSQLFLQQTNIKSLRKTIKYLVI